MPVEKLFEFNRVESDQQRVTEPHGGSAQVAGRAQQVPQQGAFVRRILHVKNGDRRPSSSNNLIDTPGQCQRFGSTSFGLGGIDRLADLNALFRKKLLRSNTCLSARSMVVPVEAFRHRLLLQMTVL